MDKPPNGFVNSVVAPCPAEMVIPSDVEGGLLLMKTDLESLFAQVAAELVNVHLRSIRLSEPGLIFPKYRDNMLRVCEQEAKVIFLHKVLTDRRYHVAVETPTVRSYSFSGDGERSAQADVSLFWREVRANIEFKADNCTPDKIEKDLEKLTCEGTMGAWFHTLGAANRSTLPTLARKFKQSLTNLTDAVQTGEGRDCLFAFCIIRNQMLVLRWLRFGGNTALQTLLNAFEELNLDSKAWTVHRLGTPALQETGTELIVTENEHDCT